ncbi:MAG: hypothetical protein QM758_17010 [Armatimonas sp.]
MTDFEVACRLALSLPEAVRNGSALEVDGKGFAWTYTQVVPGRKGRITHEDVLAIRTTNLEEKEMLIAADPEKFFTDNHYRGYPAVLTRLPKIEEDELRELLEAAWRTRAPKKTVAAFSAKHYPGD